MTSSSALLRNLIVRLGEPYARRETRPDETEIGAYHEVRETWTGYLGSAPRRVLQYAGNGRWEIFPGTYTLWRDDGGSVHDWCDVRESLSARALALLDAPSGV